ncbi:hypothetical protein OAL09_03100 [Verrucomicrobia bacterium]|nr:hypothetical protein [Verrucomicrobiales bacterium]MDC0048308.1 hypothetical protein [Verrucomicrobiota bacterium]
MIEVSQIRLPVNHQNSELEKALFRKLRISQDESFTWKIHRCSIDARKKGSSDIRLVYTIHVDAGHSEQSIISKTKSSDIKIAKDTVFKSAKANSKSYCQNPLIIGAGPCGYFAALYLARSGACPIILERGKEAGPRARDVTKFWREGGAVDPESNVQFGEGGAGTFSDGKLYTGIKDRDGAVRLVLEELASHGAPSNILFKGKPHIGTDKLIKVLRSIRKEILDLGGQIKFQTRVDDIIIESGSMVGVRTSTGEELNSQNVILAVGHSARDTFEMLHRHGIEMQSKSFSIGARIEHPQKMIDRSLYGSAAGHKKLGAAPYKFVHHHNKKKGRTCYSFCMCPGGLVVASSSEPGLTVTNGMSSYARADANANSGFMVEIFPEDFENSENPLSGIQFQREWEQKAFQAGDSEGRAPAQLLGDFMQNIKSSEIGNVVPSYRPGVIMTDIRECLPEYVVKVMQQSVHGISKQIDGFNRKDAVLTASETRSSSPLRIIRNPLMQSPSVKGLYPAGEGAGYAGGILSAAVDGLRSAKALHTNSTSSL